MARIIGIVVVLTAAVIAYMYARKDERVASENVVVVGEPESSPSCVVIEHEGENFEICIQRR